jgi:putative two-component system response regulator
MVEGSPRILIVDDERVVRDVIEASLRKVGHVDLVQAESAAAAREHLRHEGQFSLVLLDVRMPGEDGLAFLSELVPLAPYTVVIMVTALAEVEVAVQVLKAGAYDYLLKPFSPDAVQLAVARALRKQRLELMALQHRAQVEEMVREGTRALEATRHALLIGLCQMAEFRHAETGAHLRRMPEYARVLALEMAQNSPYAHLIDEEFLARLVEAAPLHDIGKVAVPDRILLKPGKLTRNEFEQVKQHTIWGRHICENVRHTLQEGQSSFIDMAVDVTYSHHERWSGTGYPEGLRGPQTPFASRIVHLVDFFDACRSSRVYRPQAIPLDDVIAMVRKGAGEDFDPHVVESFDRVLDQIIAIETSSEA